MIGKNELELMKNNSVIINTSWSNYKSKRTRVAVKNIISGS